MTQDKMRKIITAVVVAATTLFVILLSALIYGWIKIGVLSNREQKLEQEIAELEQQISAGEADAAWAEGPGKLWLALEQGWIFQQGDK